MRLSDGIALTLAVPGTCNATDDSRRWSSPKATGELRGAAGVSADPGVTDDVFPADKEAPTHISGGSELNS
jgi:hypothetical protein